MKKKRSGPHGGGCGGSGSGGGGMKVVIAVALLFLFLASPLVFFLSSFSIYSFLFVVIDSGCVAYCRRQTMIRCEEWFFFPSFVFVSSYFFRKSFLCSSHLSLFFIPSLSFCSLFSPPCSSMFPTNKSSYPSPKMSLCFFFSIYPLTLSLCWYL